MKKIISIILVLALGLTLAACGSKDDSSKNTGNTGNNGTANTDSNKDSNSGSSEKKEEKSGSNSTSDNSTGSSDSNNSQTGSSDEQNRPERNTGNNRSSMEKKIASYLSEIGGPDEISICDGDKFNYEPWSEWSMYGDEWTISGAKTTADELHASLEKQLIEGCGFQKDVSLFGYTYFKRAGAKQIGMIVNVDSEDDGTTVTVWMTHAPEKYSTDYIKEMEAKMPTIIPAANALEILPENFDMEVDYGFMKTRYARKDGNYYYGYIYPDEGDEKGYGHAEAYIRNSDGSYSKYTSSSTSGGGYADDSKFRSEGTVTEEKMQELLADWYDFEGWDDNGNPSTWGQMSIDFRNGESFLGANSRFTITQSLEKTGTENIAGVDCEVCKDSGLWSQNSFAYDPKTGIMFRIIRTENNEDKVLMSVTSYNDNPSSLGNYKG